MQLAYFPPSSHCGNIGLYHAKLYLKWPAKADLLNSNTKIWELFFLEQSYNTADSGEAVVVTMNVVGKRPLGSSRDTDDGHKTTIAIHAIADLTAGEFVSIILNTKWYLFTNFSSSWHLLIHRRSQPGFYWVKFFFH